MREREGVWRSKERERATFNERLKWKGTRTDSNLNTRNVEKSAFPTG